jgi:hypothetical protein
MFRAQLAHIEESIKTSHRCTPNQEEVLKHKRFRLSTIFKSLNDFISSTDLL